MAKAGHTQLRTLLNERHIYHVVGVQRFMSYCCGYNMVSTPTSTPMSSRLEKKSSLGEVQSARIKTAQDSILG